MQAVTPSHRPSQIGRNLAVVGAVLQIAPFVGIAQTIKGMVQAFSVMASNLPPGDPSVVSTGIGNILVTTAIGFGLAIIGVLLLSIALIPLRYRAKWLFWFLIDIGILYLILFPLGTVIGVGMIAYACLHRPEFREA